MATDTGGVKKAAPKKAAAKKAAPAKKTAAKKNAVPKKAAPAKKATSAKKVAPAKRAAPLKAAARPAAMLTQPIDEPTVKRPTVATPPTGAPLLRAPEAPGADGVRDDHVVVSFAGPVAQKRSTVAFRIILAIPHFLWLTLLNYAVGAVTVIAWVAALFTGRVPEGMARFIAQYVRYQTRVTAYGFLLLTDQYPPFALDAEDYPIAVEGNPGQLSRLAVFFRILLAIPALVVSTLLSIGAGLVTIIGWIMTLITGRLPTALHEANAAVLAYQTRTYAYFSLLTAEYPSGLFGDNDGAAPPLWDPEGTDDAPAPPATPRISRLVLSQSARRLVATFIALGAIFGVGGTAGLVALSVNTNQAFEELNDSRAALIRDLRVFNGEIQACAVGGGEGYECVHAADVRLAAAFDEFADEVETIDFVLSDDRPALIAAARQAATDLRQASRSDGPAYVDAVTAFQRTLQDFNEAYFDLTNGRD